MKIFAISDIHGSLAAIDAVSDRIGAADLVIVAGDITHRHSVDEAASVIMRLSGINGSIIAVHGNWDDPEVEDFLRENGFGLHADGRMVGGIGFFGLGGSSPTPLNTRTEYKEDEIAAFLERGFAKIRDAGQKVLVSHTPPRGLRDRTFLGLRGGSKSIRSFIEANRIDLVLCGHIHEAGGVERFGGSIIANSGSFKKGSFLDVEIARDGTIRCERSKAAR